MSLQPLRINSMAGWLGGVENAFDSRAWEEENSVSSDPSMILYNYDNFYYPMCMLYSLKFNSCQANILNAYDP